MTFAAWKKLPGVVLLCGAAVLADAGQDASTGSSPSGPPSAESVASLIDQAEAARARAASMDGEWLGTGDLIRQARESAAARDWQSALELAGRAQQQGELATAQAEREKTAWRHRVVQ